MPTINYPVSYNLASFAEDIFTAGRDVRLCILGDSITGEFASTCAMGLGLARGLRVASYNGEGHRLNATGASDSNAPFDRVAWSSANSSVSTATGTINNRDAGQNYTNLENGYNPMLMLDMNFTAGNAGAGATCVRGDLGNAANTNDLHNYANGNPFRGALTGRIVYRGKATGQTSVRQFARRNAANTGAGVVVTMSTTPGVAWSDVAIPAAADVGSPGVAQAPGVTWAYETGFLAMTGVQLHIYGFAIFDSVNPGFYQTYIATGSYTSENVLAAIGGGPTPTCLAAYVRGVLEGFGRIPTHYMHNYGQNASANQLSEYAAGGYSLFQNDQLAIAVLLDQYHATMGWPLARHCFFSNYEGGTDLYNQYRSQAGYDLARSLGTRFSSFSLHDVMPKNNYALNVIPAPWWLNSTDGVHPLACGVALAGSCFNAALSTAYSMRQVAGDVSAREPVAYNAVQPNVNTRFSFPSLRTAIIQNGGAARIQVRMANGSIVPVDGYGTATLNLNGTQFTHVDVTAIGAATVASIIAIN